jgi:hypothetical protein
MAGSRPDDAAAAFATTRPGSGIPGGPATMPTRRPEVGQTVDDFELRQLLGEGALGGYSLPGRSPLIDSSRSRSRCNPDTRAGRSPISNTTTLSRSIRNPPFPNGAGASFACSTSRVQRCSGSSRIRTGRRRRREADRACSLRSTVRASARRNWIRSRLASGKRSRVPTPRRPFAGSAKPLPEP